MRSHISLYFIILGIVILPSHGEGLPRKNDALQQSSSVLNEYISETKNIMERDQKTQEINDIYNRDSHYDNEERENEIDNDIEYEEYSFIYKIFYGMMKSNYAKGYFFEKSKNILNNIVNPSPYNNNNDNREKEKQIKKVIDDPPYKIVHHRDTLNGEEPDPYYIDYAKNTRDGHSNSTDYDIVGETFWVLTFLAILSIIFIFAWKCFSGTLVRIFGILYTFIGVALFVAKAYHLFSVLQNEENGIYDIS